MNNESDELTALKYKIGVTRNRISEAQTELLNEIMDVEVPVQSGRNYRYQAMSDKATYEKYEKEVQRRGAEPLSSSYVRSHFFKTENRHKCVKPKFCRYCIEMENCLVSLTSLLLSM